MSRNKERQQKISSLKKAYYQIFSGMIVLPLLLVLTISLVALGKQYKGQAVENIRRAQETVATELASDVEFMSMRLSQLINANDNMVIRYAAEVDCSDNDRKHEYQQKLDQAGNLMMEPVKDIISLAFYMKDGNKVFLKSEIKQSVSEVRENAWYQAALEDPNSVKTGSYQTRGANDLYQGGSRDQLVLIYAISPNSMIDRSQSVEMVVFYQTTDAGITIRNYNRNYQKQQNKLGIMQIVDETGNVIYTTSGEERQEGAGYTCVRTPVELGNTSWYVENYIKTSELMQDFMRIAAIIIVVAAFIFAFAGYFAGYFIRRIVNPIGELSAGLKQIEDGKMDIHITPQGQAEIRGVIHHFNAMARSLKSLIEEYEEQVKKSGRSPADYFGALIKGELTAQQVEEAAPEFFTEDYIIISLHLETAAGPNTDLDTALQVMAGFERNPRYTLHCVGYLQNAQNAFLLYRVMEKEYQERIQSMLKEMQSYASRENAVELEAGIGLPCEGAQAFEEAVSYVRKYDGLRYLMGESAIIDLGRNVQGQELLLRKSEEYRRLADTLYGADDKNFAKEKERLYENLNTGDRSRAELMVYAVILAVAFRFEQDGIKLWDIFGQKYNYVDKIGRLEDIRSMKMWITNYLNWVMDYSISKIDVLENDVVIKAKRYLADHYDDAELSQVQVAEHVGLNEKYFSNRFTKEAGETFSNYLTQLRIQKARELLRTTNFKGYEIAEMVGYRNAEHFTRMFKKETGITPTQYRKHGDRGNE